MPPTPPLGVERLGGYANGFASTTSQWLADGGAEEMGCAGARHEVPAQSYCPTCEAEYDPTTSIISHDAYCEHAMSWLSLGVSRGGGASRSGCASATILGGCCGIGPAHMRALARRLRGKDGHGDDI